MLRPVAGLPALRDADLNVHIVGRDAQIAVGKANGRSAVRRASYVLSSGLFEVPDTAPHEPPARVRFKLDGPVPAAAELLASDRLRDVAGVPFDPATTRGTMSAQVTLGMPLKPDLPPGSTNYAIAVDATNFSADHMIMGQKVDAAVLNVTANAAGLSDQGRRQDRRRAGELSNTARQAASSDAEVHIQGMLDETARSNLGLDPANAISGADPDPACRPRRHRRPTATAASPSRPI